MSIKVVGVTIRLIRFKGIQSSIFGCNRKKNNSFFAKRRTPLPLLFLPSGDSEPRKCTRLSWQTISSELYRRAKVSRQSLRILFIRRKTITKPMLTNRQTASPKYSVSALLSLTPSATVTPSTICHPLVVHVVIRNITG